MRHASCSVSGGIPRRQFIAWPALLADAGKIRFFAVAAVAATILSALYVRSEQQIYFWDWAGYFNLYQDYGARFALGGSDWLAQLLRSLRYDDYNVAVLTPMLPSYILFGGGRTAFVVTIVLLYLFPACFIAARLAARAGGAAAPPTWLVATALLYWPFWFSALRGMPDVAGLIPLGGATLLVLQSRFLTRASITTGITLGLAVWLAFALRRWYAYACVAIEAATFVFAAWAVWARSTTERGVALERAAAAFAANVLTIVAALLAFQAPLVVRILHTSYVDIYDAYQKPLADTAAQLVGQSGLLLLVAILAGLIRAARSRNVEIGFMAVAALVTAALFLRTQALGIQHLLPVFFWLFPVFAYGMAWLFEAPLVAGANGRRAVALVMLASCFAVFVPPAHRLLAVAGPLLPTQTYPPLVLGNREGYDELIAGLTGVLRDPSDKVAVFASSPALSDSMLATFDPAHARSLVAIANVDKRDGLWLAPFAARFAIATETPALHLAARSQHVVTIPDRMIVEGAGPGAAYHRVAGPYVLDDGVRASIYRRDRPWSDADAETVTRAIQAFYPAWTLKDGIVR